MLIRVNGKQQDIGEAETLADVIEKLGYQGGFFAVALNRVCIPRSRYQDTPVKEQDDIEILSPMQGG